VTNHIIVLLFHPQNQDVMMFPIKDQHPHVHKRDNLPANLTVIFQEKIFPACFPSSQLTPDELLPNDECNLWSKNNPQGSPDLSNRNFLQAGWATGVSTVGSTMRNANLQLRSDPPNPQKVVSPWMQTTIGPDLARKPLELGTCA